MAHKDGFRAIPSPWVRADGEDQASALGAREAWSRVKLPLELSAQTTWAIGVFVGHFEIDLVPKSVAQTKLPPVRFNKLQKVLDELYREGRGLCASSSSTQGIRKRR